MKTSTKINANSKSPGYEKYAELIRNHESVLKEKYNVKEIGIFGSYVRGEEKKRSDIDILVDYEEMPDFLQFIELEMYLQKLLKKKVDLVRKPAIRSELKEAIFNEVVYI